MKTTLSREALSRLIVWSGIAGLFLYKALFLQGKLGDIAQERGFFYFAVLHHDSIVLGALLGFYFTSVFFSKQALIRTIARILFGTVLLLYLMDLVVLKTFFTRLHFEDLRKFMGEGGIAWSLARVFGRSMRNNPFLMIFMMASFFSYLFILVRFLVRPPLPQKCHFVTLGLASLLILFRLIPFHYSYVHSWTYENFFEVNLFRGINQSYSDDFKAKLLATYQESERCSPGMGLSPNIILVIVESLSSYHSRFFSGLHDYTPNLDRLAEENRVLANFFANGFHTEAGLVALLTGTFPLPRVHSFSFQGGRAFKGYPMGETVPNYLKGFGYSSAFLTTGNLSFAKTGRWLKRIGFDEVEGHKAKDYKGWRRYHFNAAPDRALYQRTIKKVQELTSKNPYFMVLETVSSHLPFYDPEGGAPTEENVMRYVDGELSFFYDELEKVGFFDQGLLIITGDHRAMTSMTREEEETYGLSAMARIPLVMIGKGISLPGIIFDNFQQTDLLTSLKEIVSKEFCFSEDQGHFFSLEPEPPRCIFHARGDNRDLIYVRCGEEEGVVKMEGDRTRVVSGHLSPLVIDKINYERIR